MVQASRIAAGLPFRCLFPTATVVCTGHSDKAAALAWPCSILAGTTMSDIAPSQDELNDLFDKVWTGYAQETMGPGTVQSSDAHQWSPPVFNTTNLCTSPVLA